MGISRRDNDRNRFHAWVVRLRYKGKRGESKPQVQRSFSDLWYGGREQALAAAVAFRDAHLDAYGEKERNSLPVLSWQGKSVDGAVRRKKQILAGKGRVYVGTGVEAARKAQDLGACRTTCKAIRRGTQNFFFVGSTLRATEYPSLSRYEKQRMQADIQCHERLLIRRAQHTPRRVNVGTGVQAAMEARALGASKSICLRIRTGKQSFYTLGGRGGRDPQKDLLWEVDTDRKKKREAAIALYGYGNKVVVGTGIQGARKAQALGSSPSVCRRIKRGEQSSVIMAEKKISVFERNGAQRELTPQIAQWVRHNIYQYVGCSFMSDLEKDELINAILLLYVGTDVEIDDTYLLCLTKKYTKLYKRRLWWNKKKKQYALDLSGDIESPFTDSSQLRPGRMIKSAVY